MIFFNPVSIYNSINNKKSTIAAYLLFFSVYLYPINTFASISTSIQNLFGSEVSADVVSDVDTKNSQNISILKATINNDPRASITMVDPTPITQSSLIAEIGPSGTIDEVEEPINTQISTYTVRDGDTLSKIAELFDVSVNTIVWANDLNRSKKLEVGNNLIILPISGIKYTVKSGDTINSIVDRYDADMEEVLRYNDITISSKLKTGSVIIIPAGELSSQVKPKSIKGSMATNNPLRGADGPLYPGYYSKPVDKGYKSQGLHGYNAIDIAGPIGTPIYASAPGKVIVSITGGWNGGYGNFIIVSHSNGTQTLYAHNSKNLVKVGDTVERGDVIANMGKTGHATGSHVHFEIRGAKNPF